MREPYENKWFARFLKLRSGSASISNGITLEYHYLHRIPLIRTAYSNSFGTQFSVQFHKEYKWSPRFGKRGLALFIFPMGIHWISLELQESSMGFHWVAMSSMESSEASLTFTGIPVKSIRV